MRAANVGAVLVAVLVGAVQAQERVPTVMAQKVWNLFHDNEAQADATYLGKTITLTDLDVNVIQKTKSGQYAVISQSYGNASSKDTRGTVCLFKDAAAVASLKASHAVGGGRQSVLTVRGKVDRYQDERLYITDCAIIKDSGRK